MCLTFFGGCAVLAAVAAMLLRLLRCHDLMIHTALVHVRGDVCCAAWGSQQARRCCLCSTRRSRHDHLSSWGPSSALAPAPAAALLWLLWQVLLHQSEQLIEWFKPNFDYNLITPPPTLVLPHYRVRLDLSLLPAYRCVSRGYSRAPCCSAPRSNSRNSGTVLQYALQWERMYS